LPTLGLTVVCDLSVEWSIAKLHLILVQELEGLISQTINNRLIVA